MKYTLIGAVGILTLFGVYTLGGAQLQSSVQQFGATVFQVVQGGTGVATIPVSELVYGRGTAPVGTVGTTSATCSGATSCTPFTVIGPSPIIITSPASGTGLGTSSPWTAGFSVYVKDNSTLASVATSSIASGAGISVTNGTTAYVIGSQPTIVNTGVLSIGGIGQALTGAVILATSSIAFNGLTASTTITCVTQTCTFLNTLAGLLGIGGGGTGFSTYTKGDILYSDNTNSLAKLAIGTGGFVLASVNGVPGWVATSSINNGITSIGPVGALQTGPAITLATSSTAFNGLTSSTTITASGNVITFANTLAGLLGTGGGGTGLSTYTTGDLLYSSATNVLAKRAIGTGGFVLASVDGVPNWVATSTINNGVTAIGGVGQQLTGSIILATSSTAFNGLTASTTITCVTLTCTFANTLAGLLGVGGGGTGATSFSGSTLIASNGAGTALVSTTTPSAQTFTATSTTATSTFPLMVCSIRCVIESAASLVLDTIAGMVGIDTTSGQFRWSDGTSIFSAVRDWEPSFIVASTTNDYTFTSFSAATSTWYVANRFRAVTANRIYCKTTNGTMIVEIGSGSATATPALVCTTGGTNSTLSANNTFATRANIVIGAGSATTSTKTNSVTITVTLSETSD